MNRLEQFTDFLANDRECVVCNKPRKNPNQDDGQLCYVQGKLLYICDEHCDAFTIGVGFGKTDLNNNVIQALSKLEDGATGWDVKKIIYDIIPLAKRQVQESKRMDKMIIYNPREICENLHNHVVGQEQAKTRVSLSVFEHIKQIRDNDINVAPDKHNVLLLGPSGSGKSLLAHTVAQYLELPFTSADATSFSPTGFQGADVDSTITDLYIKAKGVVQTAEKGFVFFDEFDKLGTYQNKDGLSKNDTLNLNTQNSLLRLIEGKQIKVPINNMGDNVYVSTNKILFFFGGAFTGLVDIVARLNGLASRQIGFRSDSKPTIEEAKQTYDILCNASLDVMTKALIEYGLSAELVGRIPVIVPLAPLTKEQLIEFLMQMDHSPILRQKNLFAESGYELVFTDEYITALVDKVYLMATGTRALTNAVRNSTCQAAFNLLTGPINKKLGTITITEECLLNPSSYNLTLKNTQRKTVNTTAVTQ